MKHRTHCTSRDCTFSLTSTAEKPPSEEAWTTTDRATRTFLSFQKKPENEAHQFPTNPGGYVDERFHIPHPRQSQSIVDQCMALERQNALTPRGESICQRSNTGPPVILIKISRTYKDPKNLNLDRRPVKRDWQIRTTCSQDPSHRPLDFDMFNLVPELRL